MSVGKKDYCLCDFFIIISEQYTAHIRKDLLFAACKLRVCTVCVWQHMPDCVEIHENHHSQLPLCASSLFLYIHSWYWRQTTRQTGELKERQAGRQTSSQTGRQTERHTWAQGFRGQLTHSSQLSSHHRRFHYAQLLQIIQPSCFISKSVVYLHTPTNRHTTVRRFRSPTTMLITQSSKLVHQPCACWNRY